MTDHSDERWAGGGEIPGVVTIGDPALRRVACPVADVETARSLCNTMVQRLRALKGAGLAANQIGEEAAIAAIEVRKTDFFPDRPESPLYVMVNPRIIERTEALIDDWEGCFSVPGIMGRVPRSESIVVEYQDADGVRCQERMNGYLARVVQHECDHLEGTIFLDRMTSMDSISTIANYARFHAPSGDPASEISSATRHG